MGIVNAVDICKYPQHFNRLLLIAMNKYVLFLIFIFSCIGCGETNEQDANTIEGNTDTSQITIAPVTNLKAKITQNPNELYLTWTNPITVTNMLGVEIYYKQKGSNDEKRVNTIQKGEGYPRNYICTAYTWHECIYNGTGICKNRHVICLNWCRCKYSS